MERTEMVVINDGTTEVSVNLNNALNAWLYFSEKYSRFDVLQKDVSEDAQAVWDQIEGIFKLVEISKLELDLARGDESPIVKWYLQRAKEHIEFFEEQKKFIATQSAKITNDYDI
ncbi:MAG: hypothetical protein IJX46_07820 [Clostridia bacterium]|nr:hypothetical protein [Clostridia bacterium]